MLIVLFISILALASARLTNALSYQESQPEELARSDRTCTSDEFFYGSRCRSCADLNNLFYNYQEWLAGETSPVVKIANTAEANARNKLNLAATTTTIISNKAKIGKERPKLSGTTSSKIELADMPAEDVMLARLISVDGVANQPDQSDYIDSTGGGSNGSGGGGDGFLDDDEDQDSGYIESSGDQYADTIGATKQTQKLVAEFLRTSLIENELLGLVEQCRQYQNTSACQMWSNLCVMTMYSYSDMAAASSPASSSASIHQQYPGSYDSLALGRQDNGNSNGNSKFETTTRLRENSNGWQHCKQFTPTSICNSLREWHRVERRTEVQNIYSLEDPQTKLNTGLSFRLNQPIQLIAYRYSFDGRLMNVEQFGLSDMARFCAIGDRLAANRADSSSEDNNVRLGRNLKLKCQFEASRLASNLKHFNETIFIDLYIAYPANGVMFVKPVPILTKNLIYNGFQVNRRKNAAKDSSRLKLVHRFFQRSTFTVLPDSDRKPSPQQVVLFAKSATLDLKFRQQEKGTAQLSSLMLVIDYGNFIRPQTSERNPLNSTNNPSVKKHILGVEVSVLHSLIDMHSYKKDLDLVITILSILSSIWSLIKCYNIQKCYGVVKLELETLIKLILIGCDTLGNLFALINFAFLGYLFVMLKFQPNIQVLAPSEDLEAAILLNLRLAFIFKIIGFMYKLHGHLNADIFFIDWEKPKMLTSNQILSHQTAQYNSNNTISQQQVSGKVSHLTHTNTFVGVPNQQQSSFWRPYTIINRWLQLQTVRRQCITLQMLLFVCLVECFQITNLATTDLNLDLSWTSNQSPSSSSSSTLSSPSARGNNGSNVELWLPPQSSVVFRFFVLAIVYVSLSVCQIFYKKFISEPMLRNTIREFVDLCSVANVSLFCMLYPRFGYYIHGRNVNGSGECGITEMNVLLEREERDLCSKRGLAPNSDRQTFLLILPRIINDHYRKLLFTYDLVASTSSPSLPASFWFSQQQQLIGNDHGIVGLDYDQQSANKNKFSSTYNGGSLLKSALNLSIIGGPTTASSSFSSNRALIESIMIKNKAINSFLINFLEHVYKDIDYSIRERRRFENFLFDVDFDETNDLGRGGGAAAASATGLLSSTSRSNGASTGGTNGPRFNGLPMANPHQAAAIIAAASGSGGNKLTAATLCEDHQDSFTSLLWLGLEFDLVFLELFSLLILDCWLDQTLVLTTSLVWILHQTFKSIYVYLARQNLVCKALVDEKFLLLS